MALGSYRTGSGRSIRQTLAAFGRDQAAPLGRQLYREGLDIMASSQPLVPVDTGTLRASGYVEEPKVEGDKVSVQLGYGGPAAKINPKSGESSAGYAIFVHEDLEAGHKVGQAKYLETPFNEARPGMGARITDGLKAELRSGPAATEEG